MGKSILSKVLGETLAKNHEVAIYIDSQAGEKISKQLLILSYDEIMGIKREKYKKYIELFIV